MIKLAAVVGTNANFSYNRLLLKFMKKHFQQIADIDIVEIKDLPAFSVDLPLSEQSAVWAFKRRIQAADGVIFSTPEYDHSIPACLKSAVEWLSYHSTVLYHKPAMVVGVSYGVQASSRAQEHMRQILASPDCSAYVLPGHEVLIGKAQESFNKQGDLQNPEMVDDLECKFDVFVDFVRSLGGSTGAAANATELASEPTISDAYVNFPTGRLSLKEIQQIFATMPFEVDFVDRQGRFAWFSPKPQREHERSTAALGQPVEDCHPPKAVPAVKLIINSLRSGRRDHVDRPLVMKGHRVLIQYYAVRSADGHYLGTMEFTGSVEPILNMAANDAWGSTDATTGASQSADAETSASKVPATEQANTDASNTDASTGASQTETDEAGEEAQTSDTDATTGASQSNYAEDDATTGASQSDSEVDPTEVKHDADRDGLPDMAPMKPAPKPEADASTGASQTNDDGQAGDASTGASENESNDNQTDASTGASQK